MRLGQKCMALYRNDYMYALIYLVHTIDCIGGCLALCFVSASFSLSKGAVEWSKKMSIGGLIMGLIIAILSVLVTAGVLY
ncbi:hypothetical protein A9C19_16845 [Bacillus weihaiensis]|uniref:Uncharacterized protein n=1 Tax=Bacillus weihaiensis TaxID=1547283 RepID=A0A1L3MV87_9BACI|nr:hypothetical protein A9C19_16845 [Bacillus weihaiensis]